MLHNKYSKEDSRKFAIIVVNYIDFHHAAHVFYIATFTVNVMMNQATCKCLRKCDAFNLKKKSKTRVDKSSCYARFKGLIYTDVKDA